MKLGMLTWNVKPDDDTINDIINTFKKSISEKDPKIILYNVSEKETANLSEHESMELFTKFLKPKIKTDSNVFVISNRENHFLSTRILVKNKVLKTSDVSLYFVNEHGVVFDDICVDENGRLSYWPSGLFQMHIDLLSELL